MKFVTFVERDRPLLVMDYHHLGNLSTQHRQCGVTGDDCALLLHQGLQALAYLHSEGVTHRDVSPGNIIVHSRTPFTIKLCDFGQAKESSFMHTQCGTYWYTAKEVFEGNHKNKIDVWSLGVVVMEYLFGLPPASPKSGERLPDEWYDDVVRKADDDAGEDELMAFTVEQMLKIKGPARATAADCLGKVEEEFFPPKDGDPGSKAPKTKIIQGSSEKMSQSKALSMITDGGISAIVGALTITFIVGEAHHSSAPGFLFK